MYIYLYVLPVLIMYVCILSNYYKYLTIFKYMVYSRQWGHRCFIWGTFFGKKGILFAHTPKTDAIFNHF